MGASQVLVADPHLERQEAGDRPVTDVAVGVLMNDRRQFLMTTRPPGKVYAGYWEFPGGKLETGESVALALHRELKEEIGLDVGPVEVWRTQLMDYPHALVRLHFCRICEWRGKLEMRESQLFKWVSLPVDVAPVLPGALPVLTWLAQDML